jgi:hypothetical protein
MLHPSSGLKSIEGLVIHASYTKDGDQILQQRIKNGTQSKTVGKNGQRNYPSVWHAGLQSQAGAAIVRKNGHVQGSTGF